MVAEILQIAQKPDWRNYQNAADSITPRSLMFMNRKPVDRPEKSQLLELRKRQIEEDAELEFFFESQRQRHLCEGMVHQASLSLQVIPFHAACLLDHILVISSSQCSSNACYICRSS